MDFKHRVSVVIPRIPGEKFDEITDGCYHSLYVTQANYIWTERIVVNKDQSFAKNVNEGLRQAKHDLIVVCNNDVMALRGWFTYTCGFHGQRKFWSYTPDPGCGWCFGMTREVYETVGMLDENLVNSYEDYDYFIRGAMHGITISTAPRTLMLHEGGITIRSKWGEFRGQSPERLEACRKNREYMMNKWPGFPIDEVPTKTFSIYGPEMVGRWRTEKGKSVDYGRC